MASLSFLRVGRAHSTALAPSGECLVAFRWVGSLIGWGECFFLRVGVFVCSRERDRRRGAVVVACVVSIVGVLIQFLTPKHANGMLLVGKLINGFALGSLIDSQDAMDG